MRLIFKALLVLACLIPTLPAAGAREPVALQTVVAKYVPASSEKGVEIDLLAVVHIGEKAYRPPDPQCEVDSPEAGIAPSRLEASRPCFRAAVTDRDARLSALQASVRVRENAVAAAARAAKR